MNLNPEKMAQEALKEEWRSSRRLSRLLAAVAVLALCCLAGAVFYSRWLLEVLYG